MSEHKILLDETIDFNKSKQYWMSILINKSGLSFVVLDTVAKKVIAHKYIEITKVDNQKEYCYFINKIFKADDFLEPEYHKISIVYQGFNSISIPEDLYSEQHKEKFFELNSELNPEDVIVSNRLDQINARKLFTIPNCILDTIEDNFPKAKLYHQSSPIIQSVLKNKLSESVYLNINSDFFDIQIFDKKKLILDNAFKYKTKEDLLYYLLYTFEQLGLNPKDQKIILFTSVQEGNENISFLQNYFGGLDLASFPKTFNYSYLFSKEDAHQLASQILVFECE